jgi:hypothetical protein
LSEEAIGEKLVKNGFIMTDENILVSQDKKTSFTILNSNVDCPGEDSIKPNERFGICPEQRKQVYLVKEFLEKKLKHYDELIYIGHSRVGHGFGIGPFTPEFTIRLSSYQLTKKESRLKKIVMASCDSENYYGEYFRKMGLEFQGTTVPFLELPTESTPMVLEEVDEIIGAE